MDEVLARIGRRRGVDLGFEEAARLVRDERDPR
jgi:hypothetical protein